MFFFFICYFFNLLTQNTTLLQNTTILHFDNFGIQDIIIILLIINYQIEETKIQLFNQTNIYRM